MAPSSPLSIVWPTSVPSRALVVWFGRSPTDREVAAFVERNLTICESSDVDLNSHLPRAAGIVFVHCSARPGELKKMCERWGQLAVCHGAAVLVLADDSNLMAQATKIADDAGVRVQQVLSANGHEGKAAEAIARHQCGAMMGAVELALSPSIQLEQPLDPEELVLLKRAFEGFTAVRLERLTGGRSGARVLRADAIQPAGPRPVPFFVKIDQRREVWEELVRYRQYVSDYIPFHLRPNITLERSLDGARYGIMVGTFFERCHPFLTCVPTRDADAVVHSLFEHTLAGWRELGYVKDGRVSSKLFSESTGDDPVGTATIDPHQAARARRQGLRMTPVELEDAFTSLPERLHRRAPMHGDLNVYNVFARGREAAVIDFRKVRVGPLLADIAALEISLVVECRTTTSTRETTSPTISEWKAMANRLYDFRALDPIPPPADPTARTACWESCIRQLRLIALGCQTSRGEYAECLAYYLLRRGRRMATGAAGTQRAYCLVLAQRVLNWLHSTRF